MGGQVFVGIDVGSASVRAGVYDANGQRLAFAVRPIQQFHPRPLVVEQSSTDIWAQACAAVREAVAGAGVDPACVASIGVDATCSLVAVGFDGKAVSVAEDGNAERDIIMWMDHRAAEQTAAINATHDEALAYVGGEVGIEMELPKVLWLKQHFPERYAATWRLFDLADYLAWRLAGADVASVCTLTCKWNYLAHEQRFSEKLLAAVGLADLAGKIPPRILPLGSAAGRLSPRAAAETGLPPGIVVATGIIDAHAGGLALVGTAPEGSLAIIGGTSNCHMAVSREPVMVPGVWGPYFGAMLPGYWLNEGGQSAAGALLDWTLRQSDAWPLLENSAKAEGRNVYAVLNDWLADLEQREKWPTRDLHVLSDHHGNRSPRANPHARGMVVGLTLEQGKDALARLYLATLQALAYGTRHIVESMNAAGHRIERIVMCGGGTKNPYWLRENADATGCEIQLVSEEDAVTLGAALLGAVACGAFAALPEAAAAMVRPGGGVKARPETKAFHDAKYAVYLQLYEDMEHCRSAMQAWRP
ncbi:FGGY-family carbohydrate kinase [Propionivibrio limicola]|uniref:FGGY-family carbohydrate kinase n=1 Tax=Propionivibrio limicola TaxID=167645 RepID=UPI001290A372|nr:FGGY-family carbohydrate kinase [Propionivibrio limicola]